jgi:hypothetical protein
VELHARPRHDRELVARPGVELLGEPLAEHGAPELPVRGREAEVAHDGVRADGGHLRHAGSLRLDPHDLRAGRVVLDAALPDQPVGHDHRGDRLHAGHLAHLLERRPPALHAQVVAVGEHPHVGAADEDLLAQVPLQPVHHPHDEDERAHPTSTPPMAMTLIRESSREPRRERR